MVEFAFIRDGYVAGLHSADAVPVGAEFVDVTGLDVELGQEYLGGASFGPTPTAPLRMVLSVLEFRNKFTGPEKAGMELAAVVDPNATQAEQEAAAAVRVFLADLAAASYVDLTDPLTTAPVNQLETDGFLAAGRAAQILTGI